MGFTYTAFGLNLRSAFPLPGLPTGDDQRLPSLELVFASEDQLKSGWSGSAFGSAWEGSLRDGAPFFIEWGRKGELLFRYADTARFLLDPSGTRMACAMAKATGLGWQRVLLSRVLPMVAVFRGYEALHAAAVETSVGAVAVAGASGAGKSTLVAEFVRRGHRLLADDVLVIGSVGGVVMAHSGGPYISVEAGGECDLDAEILDELGGKHWMVVGEATSEAVPLAAIALLERGVGSTIRADQIPSSPLALTPFMLGLPDDERDASRFFLYADVAEGAKFFRLSGPADLPAWGFAEALERALGVPSKTAGTVV